MLRAVLHRVVKLFFRLFSRLHVRGRELIPEQGPAILASNHLSLLDAPLVFGMVERVDLSALVGHTHRKTWWIRFLVEAANSIWINRDAADPHALRLALDHLGRGGLLGIAPEGTRSRTGALIPAKTGVAYLADKAGVPIVPIAIWGTENAVKQMLHLRRPQIYIRFGEPFRLPPLTRSERNAGMQRNTDEIMLRIAAMLPEAYHGAYARQPQPEKV